MKYRISLIVPVYNVEAFVRDCLESVVKQTVTEGVECVIVDDCGTDRSMNIVKTMVHEYRQDSHIAFSVIHHEHNQGLSEARNTGIEAAHGEYIYFLDSDDTIAADCMEEMIRLIDKYPNVDMVIGNNDISDILLIPFGEYTDNPYVIIKNLLYFNGRAVAAQRHMVRRDIITSNSLTFCSGIIHEDNLWTFQLARYIKSIAFSSKDLYNYRRDNPNSIMRNKKIDREINAYKTVISKCCNNLYSYKRGVQKEYILSNLIVAISSHYYNTESERKQLISQLLSICTVPERFLLNVYFEFDSVFIKRLSLSLLHKLFRCYG